MLVSSIGYFNNASMSYVSNMDSNVKNQASKVNLTEGFGHYNDKDCSVNKNNAGMVSRVLNSVKSFFVNSKSNESSKYLSLIA